MVSISDEFQTHFPPIDTLFGTILKTTRLQHSKVTQSDCMFDVYAKIIGQYRKLFSSPSDCMNAQRCKNQSEPKSKLCTPFEANCSSILNVSLLFHALSLSDHKSGCVDVPQMCASVLSFDVVYNFVTWPFSETLSLLPKCHQLCCLPPNKHHCLQNRNFLWCARFQAWIWFQPLTPNQNLSAQHSKGEGKLNMVKIISRAADDDDSVSSYLDHQNNNTNQIRRLCTLIITSIIIVFVLMSSGGTSIKFVDKVHNCSKCSLFATKHGQPMDVLNKDAKAGAFMHTSTSKQQQADTPLFHHSSPWTKMQTLRWHIIIAKTTYWIAIEPKNSPAGHCSMPSKKHSKTRTLKRLR